MSKGQIFLDCCEIASAFYHILQDGFSPCSVVKDTERHDLKKWNEQHKFLPVIWNHKTEFSHKELFYKTADHMIKIVLELLSLQTGSAYVNVRIKEQLNALHPKNKTKQNKLPVLGQKHLENTPSLAFSVAGWLIVCRRIFSPCGNPGICKVSSAIWKLHCKNTW